MTSETEPLIAHIPDENIEDESGGSKSFDRHATTVIVISFVAVLAGDMGAFLSMAPLIRLLESAICQNYYQRYDDIPEHMCKINAIQSELSMLKGWSAVFDCLPS
jgi:hypothetical protein